MSQRITQIEQWFQTALGQRLLSAEIQALQLLLPDLFGYHLLQLSMIGQGRLLETSRIGHRFLLTDTLIKQPDYATVYAHMDALPFAAESIDVVVLPHVLEFHDNPHAILREVERVLVPEGYVILLGFNPISLWGLWRWLFVWRKIAPWNGDFLTALRIKDWLSLLSFDLVEHSTFFFAPPFQSNYLTTHSVDFLELLGSHAAWNFGAIYLLMARKRCVALTPLALQWSNNSAFFPKVMGRQIKKSL